MPHAGALHRPGTAVLDGPQALARRLGWLGRTYGVQAGDRSALATQATFDPSLIELYLPLLHGGSIALAPPGRLRPESVAEFAIRHGVTIMAFVPSTLSGFLDAAARRSEYAKRFGPAGEKLLREMYQRWPFFQTAIANAQLTMCKADMSIAKVYASMVEDEGIRERVLGRILEEFRLAEKAVLAVTGQTELLENEPVLARSIKLRNPYVDPLNYLQVEMIKRRRGSRLRALGRGRHCGRRVGRVFYSWQRVSDACGAGSAGSAPPATLIMSGS